MPHRAPDNRKSAHFAFSIDHFFVRQNRPELRAPVYGDIGNVSEPDFIRIAFVLLSFAGAFGLLAYVEYHRQVRKNGVTVPELDVTFYGMTEFRINDPDGNRLWIGQNTPASA